MTDETPTETPVETPVVPEEPKEELVPKKAYDGVTKDLLKFKSELKLKQAELEKAQAKAKELEIAGLRAKEDYKAMYEDAEKRFNDTNAKLTQTQQAIVDSTKWSSVASELLALGINPATLKDVERLIDFDSVEIEHTSLGRVNVTNAKDYAERFKAQRPYYFTSKGAPNINTGTPTVVTPGNVTMDVVKKAEAEYYKTRSPESEKKYREALLAMQKLGRQ